MRSHFFKILSVLLLILPLFTQLNATHIRGGYISAVLLENNTLTYRISLYSLTDAGSTVLFGGGDMDFGDGSNPVGFEAGNPDYSKLLDDQVVMNIFYVEHSFPGPGTYTIRYREFNRNASVANMTNSVNTPFYLETQILIDPYLGTNSTAKILNHFPFKNKVNQPYFFPINVSDPDGDSVSIESAIPLQDKDIPVSNYFVPANFDGEKILSQLQLHVPSNEIVWANPLEEDEYNFAIKILEWRFSQSENSWITVGYTLYDFQLIISERSDQSPYVMDLADTAILISQPFERSITVFDDPSDSVRIWVTNNFPETTEFNVTFDSEKYYSTPVEGKISILNTNRLGRSEPYKIVLNMNPKNWESTSSQKSTMLWITDQAGKPTPPVGLKTVLAFRNKIILNWQDQSDNEAGFVIERADSFFPDFIRIVALPENTSEFTDENVIPNRDYYYRVKAIGTEGSAYSEILEVRELDIITNLQEDIPECETILYPNPMENYLQISWDANNGLPVSIKIFDSDGKIWMENAPNNFHENNKIQIPMIDLPSGIYFIRIETESIIVNRKLVKK